MRGKRRSTVMFAGALAWAVVATGCGSQGITIGGRSNDTTTSTAAAAVSTTASTAPASTAGSVAPAALPAGWKRIIGDQTTIGVPATWFDVKPLLKDPKARGLFEQAFKDQSSSAYLDALTPEIVDKLDVLAVEGATVASGNPTNLTITVEKNSLVKDLATLNALLPGQLPKIGATPRSTQRATIGGLDTLVVDYTIATKNGQGTGRQYDHFNGPDLVVVTFTAPAGKEDFKLWDQIAATVASR